MADYNYEIERTFAKYGGEADKGVERTCGNCESYIKEHWACGCADAEDNDFHKATDAGCYYHRTHTEQKLLKNIIDERRRLDEQKRVEDNRRNGTGDCAGCPFRNVNKELYDFAHFFETFAGQCYCRILDEAGQKIYDEAVKICKKARGEE